MGTQRHPLGILGTEALLNLSPQQTACTHLGNLGEEVHRDTPEERQTGSKSVNRQTGIHTSADVVHTIGQGVCQLNVGGSTSFLHVITRNRNRVELGHILRGVLKDAGNNLHRELGRIDVGVTHHELLQNIVLDCTCHLFELSALLQT